MRAILMYHSIDRSGSPISVAPEEFAAHVRWLASGAVRVVPLDALARPMPNDDRDTVALTFDDGFANVAEHAAPLLRAHGLPATMFVVSAYVGRTNAWRGRETPGIPTLPLLDWDAVGRLTDDGFTLGAHTRTHPWLGTLSASAMADEIVGGAADIAAATGQRPTTFAYPYGDAPHAAIAQVRDAFAAGVTTRLSTAAAADDVAALPRLDAYYFRRRGQLESWGSLRFAAYLRLRAAARTARRAIPLAARSAPDRHVR